MNNKVKIIIGLILILLPFLGFPREVKNIIFVIIGVLIISFALRQVRKEHKTKMSEVEKSKDVFVESRPEKPITPRSTPRVRKPKPVVVPPVVKEIENLEASPTIKDDQIQSPPNE